MPVEFVAALRSPTDSFSVKQRAGWLIGLGVLAVLAFALATLPASLAARPLASAGIHATGFTGSIWSGRATGLAWGAAQFGDAAWTLAPLALLRGRAAGHATLARVDGSLETDFEISLAGRQVALAAAKVALPIEAFNGLPLGMPKGWRGRVSGTFDEIRLEQAWPTAIRGSLEMDGLIAPPPRNAPVGSFHVVFPHPRPQPSLSVPQDPANLTAQVTDKEGPFSVQGQLTLSPSRNFSFEGTLAPRGPVPPAMERSLQLLGPADATGRRQFSVGGTL